ncbi:Crp/Fnr family transcriptional regulator [Sphingosinicella terrae]|uniref:Crp/Fnr family transcriptional regulator n=1 Tax=Sphingosinicella terrae TaxID=2172047 RepID=UPI000E0CDDF9|nr:Crp/Fnr family transcriptional regulator [Sphingosinicella terrae]
MSTADSAALQPMVRRLRQLGPLDEADVAALLALPFRRLEYRPQEHIVREGDSPQRSCLLLSGFAFRHKVAGNGGRQIFSIHMKGDLADLQNSLLGIADHNLQALTHVEAALIPVEAIRDLAFDRPAIGRAMWTETLVDASIFREWTLNVGRRDARTRMAHLLCEFSFRLAAAGLGEPCRYELPMTQEQLADALGLTSVHVNRTLMALEGEGLIERRQRAIRIGDWPALARAGDFDAAYLHLREPQPA